MNFPPTVYKQEETRKNYCTTICHQFPNVLFFDKSNQSECVEENKIVRAVGNVADLSLTCYAKLFFYVYTMNKVR